MKKMEFTFTQPGEVKPSLLRELESYIGTSVLKEFHEQGGKINITLSIGRAQRKRSTKSHSKNDIEHLAHNLTELSKDTREFQSFASLQEKSLLLAVADHLGYRIDRKLSKDDVISTLLNRLSFSGHWNAISGR